MLVLSLVNMSVAVVITAFSPNVWVNAALRFMCRFGRSMAGTSAMVLSMELVGKWWRNTVSFAGFVFFSVGFMSLPVLAYTFREASWRTMWGVAGGEGMLAMLRSICEWWWALQRLATITTASFSIGVVYYGMPLSVGSLSFDLYSVAYNTAAELPSSFLSWLLMGRFNRRSSVVELTAVSGLCSLACIVIPADPEAGTGGLRLAAELSFFASCATTRSSRTTASRRGLGRAASTCAAALGRRPAPPRASRLPLRCTLAW
uniref:Major facilitator superfamily (MFS) profile domain-containing protein n=1 Tax=Oryza barthii TaxID=65489 RepID=A0A0D3GRZ1_9ORYZ